jgi:hypothetical protein
MFVMLIVSCATSTGAVSSPVKTDALPLIETAESLSDARKISLTVENPTRFDIYFDEGQRIEKKSRGTVTLFSEDATLSGGFDIRYEIPLSDTVVIYPIGDHQTIRGGQTSFTAKEPQLISGGYGPYIKISNRANNAISFYTSGTVNPSWEQKGNPVVGDYLTWTDKREFSPDETAVFNISSDISYDGYSIKDGQKNIPFSLPKVEKNFLYEFEYYSSGSITLTDARPLRRIGEPGWAKTVADANYPPALVQGGDGEAITFLAAGENGATLYSLPPNSTAWDAHTRQDTSVDTTVLMRTKDGRLLLVGYQYNGSTYTPFVQKQSPDGNVQWQTPASTRQDSRSAYLLAAAEKGDDTWLVAGGADTGVNSSGAYRPYIREIRDTGAGVESVWELGPGDFDTRCGAVDIAVYDIQYKVWRVAGKLLPDARNTQGTYICTVADGNILSTDMSLEHFSFSKICAGNNGYYLIGEEQKPNGEVYAVALYYDAAGKKVWQQAAQLKSYSYYQDALVDSENKQLVLVGTMGANNDRGKGGTPFIQGVNPENGTQLWLQELNDPAFGKAALVYQMIKAPDYGYILSLTGMADDFYAEPFIVARVNAQGRLIK